MQSLDSGSGKRPDSEQANVSPAGSVVGPSVADVEISFVVVISGVGIVKSVVVTVVDGSGVVTVGVSVEETVVGWRVVVSTVGH